MVGDKFLDLKDTAFWCVDRVVSLAHEWQEILVQSAEQNWSVLFIENGEVTETGRCDQRIEYLLDRNFVNGTRIV